MTDQTYSRRNFLSLAATLAVTGVAGSVNADSYDKIPTGSGPTSSPPRPSGPGGKNVRTVRGLMAPEHLGITDMHEHVLRDHVPDDAQISTMFDKETLEESAMFSEPEPVPDRFFPQKGNPITLRNRSYLIPYYANGKDQFVLDESLMTGELEDFAALGGKSILDCSVSYERGDVKTVRAMSERTGVNVVMSTGINSHVLLPQKFKSMTVTELAQFFEKEIEVGIDDTDICCGNIKLFAESGQFGRKATEDVPLLRGLEAAASISRNNGVPVTVHAYLLGNDVLREFLQKAMEFGMPEGRMILAHFPTALMPMSYKTLLQDPKSFTPDFDIGYWAMDRGFVLSFDLFGSSISWVDKREGLAPPYDPLALAAIYQYVKAGYGDRIVMGMDVWMRNSTRRYGGAGFAGLLNSIVPTLLENGLSQKEIDTILIATPARMLAF